MKKIVQTAGRTPLGEFAPEFAHLNDDILFGEVWSRNDLLSSARCSSQFTPNTSKATVIRHKYPTVRYLSLMLPLSQVASITGTRTTQQRVAGKCW